MKNNYSNIIDSKEQLKKIINNVNDAIFIYKYINGRPSKFLFVNKGACEKLGYTREELLSFSLEDIDIHELDEIYQIRKSAELSSTRENLVFESKHITKEGKIIPVEISSSTIFFNGQEFLLSVARDITKRKNAENKLIKFQNLLQSTIDSLPGHIAVLDNKGIIKYTNKSWKEFVGNSCLLKKECIVGKNYLKACKVEENLSEEIQKTISGLHAIIAGKKDTFNLRYSCDLRGEKSWYELAAASFAGNGPYAVVLIHRNITREKSAEKKMFESEKKFRRFVENANDIIYTLSSDGIFNYVSPNWEKIIGHSTEDVEGSPFSDFIHRDDIEKCRMFLKETIDDSKSQNEIEYRVKCKNGNWKWHSSTGSILEDEEKNKIYFLGVARDITERKKYENKIKYLSFHDELTGLYNRRYFENEMERLNKSRSLPISIIITDLDRLKDINDKFGHKKGDEYIKKGAELLKRISRKEDVVARIGGDEYAMILPETSAAEAEKICRRINLGSEKVNNNYELNFGVTAGWATKVNKSEDLERIFQKADKHMYHNKPVR